MIRFSFNLPIKRRLHLEIVKRREGDIDESLFPKIAYIKRVRKGSKVSRFFRHVFEHKNMRRIFGVNMTLLIAASSVYPAHANLRAAETENSVISQNAAVLTTQKGVQYPTREIKITQTYKFYHPGLDLDGITGDSVKPIMAGKVEAIDRSKYAYGNAILIDHGNSITSLYAHLSKIEVTVNEEVDMNTEIGEVGATGRATGDHLHLEIRDHGIPFNPSFVLPK